MTRYPVCGYDKIDYVALSSKIAMPHHKAVSRRTCGFSRPIHYLQASTAEGGVCARHASDDSTDCLDPSALSWG